ncbi:unnamed protein product [Gadus morhua 'NCC']
MCTSLLATTLTVLRVSQSRAPGVGRSCGGVVDIKIGQYHRHEPHPGLETTPAVRTITSSALLSKSFTFRENGGRRARHAEVEALR